MKRLLFLSLYSFLVGIFLFLVYTGFEILNTAIFGKKRKNKIKIKLPETAKKTEKIIHNFGSEELSLREIIFKNIFDFLFCIFSAFTVIILIYHVNNGEIRGFALVNTFVSFVIFRMTLGKPIRKFSLRIIKSVKLIIRKTVYVILKPIKIIIYLTFGKLYLKVRKALRKKYTDKYIKKEIGKAKKGYYIK